MITIHRVFFKNFSQEGSKSVITDIWGGGGAKTLSICKQSIWKIWGPRNMLYSIVRSTISMRSMLMLGVSGGMPPRKILKNTYSEIESETILECA